MSDDGSGDDGGVTDGGGFCKGDGVVMLVVLMMVVVIERWLWCDGGDNGADVMVVVMVAV